MPMPHEDYFVNKEYEVQQCYKQFAQVLKSTEVCFNRYQLQKIMRAVWAEAPRKMANAVLNRKEGIGY